VLTELRTDEEVVSVIDASVFVDALVGVGIHGELARQEVRSQPTLQVPAIFAAESTSAIRGLVLRGDLSAIRAAAALDQVRRVRTLQYPLEPFAQRVWELRDNLTVYEAWYVALAEWLGTDLVTGDERLTNATGPHCDVRLPGAVL
jgi:predicted nucleic acid-binding protein